MVGNFGFDDGNSVLDVTGMLHVGYPGVLPLLCRYKL